MKRQKPVLVTLSAVMIVSGASAIELNSSDALKYYGQGTQDFRVSPNGNALVDDGTLNITNSGEPLANFTPNRVKFYKPLELSRSTGTLALPNGAELTGTTSNTIESRSTFYLTTSSGTASDIVLNPTGEVGVDTSLETTGNVSIGGKQLNLEDNNISNVDDIQTGAISDNDGDSGINLSYNQIYDLQDPDNPQDAATKEYVDTSDVFIPDDQNLGDVAAIDNRVGGQNINFNETSNIQAQGTNAITLDNNQNIGIPNGNLDLNTNNILNPNQVDGVDLDDPGNAITTNGDQYAVASGSIQDDEISDNTVDSSEIQNSNAFTFNGITSNADINANGNSVNNADDIETNDIFDDDDNTLRVQDNLQVEGKTLINSESTVSSSSGQLYTGYNLDFPDDPYGGGGDTAFLTYRQDGSGEDTELRLGIADDNSDNIVLEQAGAAALNVRGSQTVDIESGNLELSDNNIDNAASIDGGGDAIRIDDALNINSNNLDDVASVDGGGDAVQVNDAVQLNSNALETDNNGNYINSSTAAFSNIRSGGGQEVDVQDTIDFNSVNMKNIQFEDAGDLGPNGDILDDNVENAELNNDQLTVASNTVSLGGSTPVSVNDLSDVSSTSETNGQTLLYDNANNQYTNAKITAGQGLGRTTTNGALTIDLNTGNAITTNNDDVEVADNSIDDEELVNNGIDAGDIGQNAITSSGNELDSSTAGNGISLSSGSLDLNAGDDLSVNSDDLDLQDSIDLSRIDFTNEESASNSDGAIAFDGSEGLMIYRTQQPGDVSGNDDYLLLDRANIEGGNAVSITGGKGDGSSPVSFKVGSGTIEADEIGSGTVTNTEVDNSGGFTFDGVTSTSDIDLSDNRLNFSDTYITEQSGDTLLLQGRDPDQQLRLTDGGSVVYEEDAGGGNAFEVDSTGGADNAAVRLGESGGNVPLDMNDNNVDDIASVDGGGDSIQVNDAVQLNSNALETDNNGNYINSSTAAFSNIRSGSGQEITLRDTVNFGAANNIQSSGVDAITLDSDQNVGIPNGNLSLSTITNSGEAVANFTDSGVKFYKPLELSRSTGTLALPNGAELTGTTSNTIESRSTFYLTTSSGTASDIVLNPTGQTSINSNLETTGNISISGEQLDLENGDINNVDDIQTGAISDNDGDDEIGVSSNRLTDLRDPSGPQDAATRSYVDTNDDTIPDDQNLEEVLSLDNRVGGQNINFNETSNIQASGTNAITLDNNQNIGIPNGKLQLNNNPLETDNDGNYINSSTAAFSELRSGSGSEIDVRSNIDFNNVNMRNIQFEDAGDLDSNGDTVLEFTNINDTNGDTTINSVDKVEVDEAAGFRLQSPGSDTARLTMGSHWKTIYIDGSKALTPSGQEPLNLATNNELTITGDNTTTPQKLTFDVNAGNVLAKANDLDSNGDITSFSDASDLGSNGDILDGNVENAELNNDQVTVASNTVSLGGSTSVSINDLSDVSSTSETNGQTLLYDNAKNRYRNAKITAGQGLGRTTTNGALTIDLNTGNGIETNSDNTRVNPAGIAGDGLKETSATQLGVEPADLAGTFLSDDGSDNLQVDTGTFISGDGNGNINVDISNGLQDDGNGNIEVNWNDADDLDSDGKISDFSEANDLGPKGDVSDNSVQDAELDLANGLTVAGGSSGDGTQSGLEVDGNGNLYFSGSLNFPGDTNIISAQELNGSFIPSKDAQFSVGSTSKQWKNGYFSGTVEAGGVSLDGKIDEIGGKSSNEIRDDGDLVIDSDDKIEFAYSGSTYMEVGKAASEGATQISNTGDITTSGRLNASSEGGEISDDSGTSMDVQKDGDVVVTLG